jgi:NNP family nitrate/nitrite transporter-like MFS transporter
MAIVKGTPAQGLIGATLGFFIGFAAVSLFGPTVGFIKGGAGVTPALAGLLISIPNLSGSLLRIPFSAMVDTTGGRKPFLILLSLSFIGVLALALLITLTGANLGLYYPWLLAFGILAGCGSATFSVGISQTSYWFPQARQGRALAAYAGIGNLAPGIFALLLSAVTLPLLGLAGSYFIWLGLLGIGIAAYSVLGRNAWYFQLLDAGTESAEARRISREEFGQELFPKAKVSESLAHSARTWQTWALVAVYFCSFGGFMALTGWLPKYWLSYHGTSLALAGGLTALYSLGASLVRVAGGGLSDRFGGSRTALAALLLTAAGALTVSFASALAPAVAGIVLMAAGMGICNAAVFKLVPQEVPEAIGGAAGWVGGLGAFGGFVIPNVLAGFVTLSDSGTGYARGFLIFLVLSVLSMVMILLVRSFGRTSHRMPAEAVK